MKDSIAQVGPWAKLWFGSLRQVSDRTAAGDRATFLTSTRTTFAVYPAPLPERWIAHRAGCLVSWVRVFAYCGHGQRKCFAQRCRASTLLLRPLAIEVMESAWSQSQAMGLWVAFAHVLSRQIVGMPADVCPTRSNCGRGCTMLAWSANLTFFWGCSRRRLPSEGVVAVVRCESGLCLHPLEQHRVCHKHDVAQFAFRHGGCANLLA